MCKIIKATNRSVTHVKITYDNMFITQQVKPLSKHHRINEKKQLKERKTIDLHKKIEKEDVILMAHRAFLKNTQQIYT
ncbi:hypothetical protein DW888_17540 [Bacteroides nordii]|uniref:Uncharacterized protein n=1 Tax=Bacteroides nordii TaxID=291645 RepID=A0A413VDZ7_9BACE|nr:hypothetical protein DW888_17540 [Bacteroides nordii]